MRCRCVGCCLWHVVPRTGPGSRPTRLRFNSSRWADGCREARRRSEDAGGERTGRVWGLPPPCSPAAEHPRKWAEGVLLRELSTVSSRGQVGAQRGQGVRTGDGHADLTPDRPRMAESPRGCGVEVLRGTSASPPADVDGNPRNLTGPHPDTKSTDSALQCAIVSGVFATPARRAWGFGNPSGAHDVRWTDGVLIILGGPLARWLTR
jgi:hypothetical protein